MKQFRNLRYVNCHLILIPDVDCGVPPAADWVDVSYYNTTYGYMASYSCTDGSKVSLNSTCQESGIWTAVNIVCQGIYGNYETHRWDVLGELWECVSCQCSTISPRQSSPTHSGKQTKINN